MQIDDVKIDKDFKILCPPLSHEELRQLCDNIIADKEFREPLTVWNNGEGTLIDGHNRLDVWGNLNDRDRKEIDPPKIKLMDFASRKEAHDWIITNQLGRRNLSAEQRSYLVGKRYKSEKKDDKKNLKRGIKSPKSPAGQNVPPGETAENIGKDVGKSGKQVKRDAKFATAVDTIAENVGQEAKQEILNGPKKLAKNLVVEIAAEPPEKMKAAFERAVGRGEPKKITGGITFNVDEFTDEVEENEKVVASGVITEHHLKEMQASYREIQTMITKLKKAVAKLPNGGAGGWHDETRQQDIQNALSNFKAAVNIVKPAGVCFYCEGKKCDNCRQTGVLPKVRMSEGKA